MFTWLCECECLYDQTLLHVILLVPVILDISHLDSASGGHFYVEQQQLEGKADDNHDQDLPSDTEMAPNQAYSAHIFGSGDPHLPQDKTDSQHWQHFGDSKMTPNLAYGIFTSELNGQQQLQQDESNYVQVEVHSARNVTSSSPKFSYVSQGKWKKLVHWIPL